ncbi:MAG: UDP-N-acetylmuramate--L-alanine ligase [Eubacterium sp.]|nr:UDP-N-acetylmuramate--L-alanine ligase [Eubacterium sp.]
MYNIDFNNPVHAHFIGIGGISMSGFAMLLHSMGFHITGSDREKSEITENLETLGIDIKYEQIADNINDDIDVVIYTAAIHPDNPEYAECIRRGIPMLERAELVGQVMTNYSTAIAVAGTHGKTTTTSMISELLIAAGSDPTISVGGILPSIGGNIRIGSSKNFITEACEYTNSFLKFHPTIGIILNIEEDHMDFFKDINDIRASFRKFAALIPDNGTLIISSDIPDHEEITEGLSCNILTFGMEHAADYTPGDISYDDMGCAEFDVFLGEKKRGRFHINVPGVHNVSNALASVALSDTLGISDDALRQAFDEFRGANRRFEYKGKLNGFTIIDDYAHHPTEIRATLKAAAKVSHRDLWVAFQPHTYSRTKAFLHDFADALSAADHIMLTDIYAAREPDPGDISSVDIAKLLEAAGKDVTYFNSFDSLKKFILKNLVNDDLLITMGAGNIVNIGDELLGK